MARSMPSTPLASTRSIAPAANTRSASSTSPQHHPPNQPQLGSIHHPQNQIGVSTLGSQSRRKESSLINLWYLPLYGCGACGVVVNALELSTNPQANLRATATTSLCDARRTRESELKLPIPAVSKSLTRTGAPSHRPSPQRAPTDPRGADNRDRSPRYRAG